jgi:hypothetical protein
VFVGSLMSYQELNRIHRLALGPEGWAEGILAAIYCNHPDLLIQQEIDAASELEREALNRLIIATLGKAKLLKESGEFSGAPFVPTAFLYKGSDGEEAK